MSKGVLVCVLMVWASYSPVTSLMVGRMDESGSCTYNFQVWSPNMDILNQIDRLDSSLKNRTAFIRLEVSELRREIELQRHTTQNITNFCEKQLLQYKVDDSKVDAGLKDIRLEIMENKGETSKIWAFLNQIQSSIIKGVYNNHNNLPAQEPLTSETEGGKPVSAESAELSVVIRGLKNGIGNLKAEWLLLKREVKDVKAGSSHIQSVIDVMEEDTVTLKSALDAVKTDVDKVQDAFASLNNTLMSFRKKMATGNVDLDDTWTEFPPYDDEIYDDLVQLKKDYARLETKVSNLSTKFSSPSENHAPKDCHDVYKQGFHSSGVYFIKLKDFTEPQEVYCQMVGGTGWTVLNRRQTGTVSFSRRWKDYKLGFGNLYGEFWLGNQMIHSLTNQSEYILHIDMWDWDGNQSFAEYTSFKVADEKEDFRLKVDGFSGNAGDSLTNHSDKAFSTEDRDNDGHRINCAFHSKSGWWFDSCFHSNLNGMYHIGGYGQEKVNHPYSNGIVWYTWRNTEFYSLKKAQMKIRPRAL